MKDKAIAHENQTLKDHLEGVAKLSRRNAGKIGCESYGEMLGLLHDVGKYSQAFQDYIKSAVGILNPDYDEEFVDARGLKGKIDHSTAGAQFLWKKLSSETPTEKILAQILSLCLVSHHSGIIDCLTTDFHGTFDSFTKRIVKANEKTHLDEIILKTEVLDRLNQLITEIDLTKVLETILEKIFLEAPEKITRSTVFQFQLGLFVRFLFSCLIDADRQDTSDSEKPRTALSRQNGLYLPWGNMVERLEKRLAEFGNPKTLVDSVRKHISEQCLIASQKDKGLFSLTVPTGGGKTLASLRFALHHAKRYDLDRIIYVIPFTSIIDQNAEVVRCILETNESEKGRIVLEHHSNIGAEKQSWKEKLLTENWDAPVVFTTMVQFLETLFGSGTRGARRMHQLAKAVIVFDEIQTLPIRCAHMFCNSVNFLVSQCRSSVVLCTATQPLLGEIDKVKGSLSLTPIQEIMPNVQKLFDSLKRVEIFDSRKPSGWNDGEIVGLAVEEVERTGSCLIVVNMKRSARSLFIHVNNESLFECFHLSTSMCPAHRKIVLKTIHNRLAQGLPTLCISTQLIEAGVDIDFGSVIRFVAGLDSIAQAAGRCNRNGNRSIGRVHIVNPLEENIDCLNEIKVGIAKTNRVLDDFMDSPEKYQCDPVGPSLLAWYYRNYFFDRKPEMDYPVPVREAGRNDTILNLLSSNRLAVSTYRRKNSKWPDNILCQSFMTGAELFKSIDAPTQSVIVRYGDEGEEIVNQLCSVFEVEKQFALLQRAQQYSVNLFPHEFKRLSEQKALLRVQEETEIFYLDANYYSEEFGISMEPIYKEGLLNA